MDASRAGEGQLEISVNHGEVPNQVEVLSSGKCIISFVPEKAGNHVVEIRYSLGPLPIPNGLFSNPRHSLSTFFQ